MRATMLARTAHVCAGPSLYCSSSRPPLDPPSFPTRRSSDLGHSMHVLVGVSGGEDRPRKPNSSRTCSGNVSLAPCPRRRAARSEEHTSELHVSISYAVFCLKKKKLDTATKLRANTLR